jgi:formylglycine-generating enzyme required for sulfatase activity
VPDQAAVAPPSGKHRPPAPPVCSDPDQPTVPPSQISDLPTAPPASLSDGTESPGTEDSDHDASLTAFLAPPEAAGELGRLGGFRILKILGHGGMGVVFEGEDPRLGRRVAIKAMLPHLAGSKSSQERFLREAKAAAALEHDHVVPILQVGEDRGAPFIVMPFLKGEPLDARLKRDERLAVAEVLRIGREIAEGLAAAHAEGLVHRDIKPANVWLEAPRQRVKILDFGLARATAQESGLTQQGAILGTPAYMAPEQGRGQKVDARCDLWSLGVVLYRLVAGRLPFKGADTVSTLLAVATAEPPPPAEVSAAVPVGLSCLIMQLLEKEPARRPASAEKVAGVLRALEQDEQATQELPRAPGKKARREAWGDVVPVPDDDEGATAEPVPARRGRGLLLLALGGALVAAAAAVAVVLFWQTPHGTVRIESDDPNVEIVFDQTGPTIKGADKEPITLRAGEHDLLVKRGDLTFETDKVLIRKGETLTLKVELLPREVRVKADGRVIGAGALPPVDLVVTPPPPEPLPKTFTNKLGMEFVLVPQGKSWLGGGGGKPGRTEVEIPQDFYLGKYEVTQEEWQKVLGNYPSKFSRVGLGKGTVRGIPDADLKRFPVEQVSWDDCQLFIRRLNDRVMESGWVYRLPTATEWEYACRGGPLARKEDSAFYFYAGAPADTLTPDRANFDKTGLLRPCKVGSYPPNALGLYDMHGNVWEWCDDAFVAGAGPPLRAYRGGCWRYDAWRCRAADRANLAPSSRWFELGLRLARVPVAKSAPTFTNSLGMEFVLVPRGKSWLSGGRGKPGNPEVEVLHDFYLGKYEVTQDQWQQVMGESPSAFRGSPDVPPGDLKRFPVESVSWDGARLFLKQLNAREKETGWVYRLPSEQEWEYACRGGPLARREDSAFDFYPDGPTNTLPPDKANFGGALKRPCKVASYPPNRLGLYDMHGNVWEWCSNTPLGPGMTPQRVARGGGWDSPADMCRASSRLLRPPSARFPALGLRVARVPAGQEGTVLKPLPEGPSPEKGLVGEFVATIKKVEFLRDGTRLTVTRRPFPFAKGRPPMKLAEETLTVAENVKVVHGIVRGFGQPHEAGAPIEGGLRNELFASPVACWLITNDRDVVTEIRALPGIRFGPRPPLKKGQPAP